MDKRPTFRRIVYENYNPQALIDARNRKGLTQRAVAAELKMSYTHLCYVENGGGPNGNRPGADVIEKLCAFYGIPESDVIVKAVIGDPTFA